MAETAAAGAAAKAVAKAAAKAAAEAAAEAEAQMARADTASAAVLAAEAEVVAERLVAYHDQTAPVVGWFSERGAVCAVDGNQDPDTVFAACVSCMEVAQ